MMKHYQKFIILIKNVIRGRREKKKNIRILQTKNVNNSDFIVDIGVETISLYQRIISKSSCVIWNGPMGIIEISEYLKVVVNPLSVLQQKASLIDSEDLMCCKEIFSGLNLIKFLQK